MVFVGDLSAAALGYALLVVIAALACGLIAAFSWRRRTVRGGTSLAALMAGAAVWNGCTAAQLLTAPWGLEVGLQALKLGGVGVVVGGLFALALEFSGRIDLLDRRAAVLLSIEPVTIATLSATNGWHGLVWRSIEPAGSAFDTVGAEAAVAFWVHTAYSYVLLVAALGLLTVEAFRSRSIYRKQVLVVLAAASVPIAANLAMLIGFIGIDLQAFAFVVTGVVTTWGCYRYRLIDLVPVAREYVVETLPDPVFVLDDRNRITDVNGAGSSLLGASEDDLVGVAFGDAFEEYPDVVSLVGESVQTEALIELPVRDDVRHFEVRSSPVSGDRGDASGRVLRFHDVTEREENRRELEHQNEQLERFASVVSHDLRNPLTVAEGYLELARESDEEEHYEAVEESLDRMNAIIEDVLTLAREGSRIADREPTSLRDVAETAWSQVDTDDAQFVVAEDVTIAADRDRLQRLLENCFRNSIEHAGGHDADDGPTVTVGPIELEDTGTVRGPDTYGFYVEDDGAGIPEDEREEIFEPGHSSSSEGTGLGLSIVQGIAEAHGWSVRETAAENGGARFEFTGAPPVSHPATAGRSEAADGAQR